MKESKTTLVVSYLALAIALFNLWAWWPKP
jgi:hypothetical protein